MKIVLVTGSLSSEGCGVGDYTSRLAEALSVEKADVAVVRNRLRTPGEAASFVRMVRDIQPAVIHMQYPTRGFGYSPLPQGIANYFPMVVTVHEVSQAHVLRKLSLFGFATRSRRLVFTSQFELDFALRGAPWIRAKSVVIPIGTNISLPKTFDQGRSGLAYFGLIRPNKGLEDFVEVVGKIPKVTPPISAHVIGAVHSIHVKYYERLRALSKNLPIEWIIGLDQDAVADRLSHVAVGYLPFPDGASERRASLLAMFAARVPVVTTRGSQTPGHFRELVEIAENADDAALKIGCILGDPAQQRKLQSAGWQYLMNRDWSAVAQRHMSLYEEVAGE